MSQKKSKLSLLIFSLNCIHVYAQEIILVNGESGTSSTGTWGISGRADPYGANSLWSRDGASYTWHVDLPQSGVYEVYMWWTEYASRSTNAPVTITHLSGSSSININQQQDGGQVYDS